MLRNNYNCFADPFFMVFILIVLGGVIVMKFILGLVTISP
jgi:hypothetical protein